MPYLKHIALAGAGNLGSFILDELVTFGNFAQVTVLTRPSSDKTFPAGVNVKAVDYADQVQLEQALEGVDAVVSVLTAFDSQNNLVHAAKAAGVKLFVPSEFGNPTLGLTTSDHPALYGKVETHALLRSVQLPSLLVFTGPFLDQMIGPVIGLDFAALSASIVGTGATPISFTARADIGRFLAHHLGSLSASALPQPGELAVLPIEGDRASLLDVVAAWERHHPGKKVSVSHVPLPEADAAAANVQGDFFTSLVMYLRAAWERGATVDQGKGRDAIARWDGWAPLTVEEHFRAAAAAAEQ
ncbi:hypothetical protein JCM10207_006383 [Rhodosporidiobolus poonsookiae]